MLVYLDITSTVQFFEYVWPVKSPILWDILRPRCYTIDTCTMKVKKYDENQRWNGGRRVFLCVRRINILIEVKKKNYIAAGHWNSCNDFHRTNTHRSKLITCWPTTGIFTFFFGRSVVRTYYLLLYSLCSNCRSAVRAVRN